MKNTHLKQIIQTALFIALALVVRQFSFMIPMGGVNGMRIGVSEVFTKMPAILFGPILGGASSGLVDLLAQVIKSEGAYLWPIFFVMVLGGVLTGLMWMWMKKIPSKNLRIGFSIVCGGLFILGIYNIITVTFIKSGWWFGAVSSLGKNIGFATYGLCIAGVFGALFLLTDFLFKKKAGEKHNDDFLQLTLTIFTSDIVVTTLNTFVLRHFYTGLAKIPFWIYYTPRLIQDLINAVIFAYIISHLLKVYHKIIKK